MSNNNKSDLMQSLQSQIDELPVGYISKKRIHGNTCHYRQWKENGRVKSCYVPADQLDYIVSLINKRKELQSQLRIETYRNNATNSKAAARLYEYGRRLHLESHVSIGIQDYETLISNNLFYVDKTQFISDWWNNNDSVTLINRPRRFGKTLNMSMVNCFFSMKYRDRSDLFDKFDVWRNRKMRNLQGTFPTIFISFGGIKEADPEGQLNALRSQIYQAFSDNRFLMEDLSPMEQSEYTRFLDMFNYTEDMILNGLNVLCNFFYIAYSKKTIILIDEYDTPMLEAQAAGKWSDYSDNMRLFFNKTLKTNPYVEKALLTGITRISKESFFSDMNHICVCSMTSSKYDYAFGFTEAEVKHAMKAQKFDNFDEIKKWYDGFSIGRNTDIYNPWSIINFLSTGEIKPYWVNSSSNSVINTFFKEGKPIIKQALEDLINNKTILTPLKEETLLNQIASSPSALWSLLFASGYLKVINTIHAANTDNVQTMQYELAVTNNEVRGMLIDFIKDWFDSEDNTGYGGFINALLIDDIDYMQEYLSKTIKATFSYFDVSGDEPERFYHGFILGMIIDLRDRFTISSNRESGLGRYDVMLIPKNPDTDHAIILEFKIHRPRKESSLVETAQNALRQINEKEYSANMVAQGIDAHNIYKYGIAFKGKDVWIEGSN